MVAPIDLTKLAKGQICHLRLTGCRRDTKYTVLCHIRRFNIAGGGEKPPDICALPACDICHAIIDGRTAQRQHGYERYELDVQTHRAHLQWLARLSKLGYQMVLT